MPAPRVVSIGDCLIAMVPRQSGSLIFADDYRRMLVGAELNVCIGCARLRVSSGLISRVSDDPFGHYALRRLRAEEVDVSQITPDDPRRPAALLFKERLPGGDFRVYYHRHDAAGGAMELDEGMAKYVRGARAFFYTGIFPALSPVNHRTLQSLLAVAQAAGVMRVFDPNVRMKLLETPARVRKMLRPLAARADLVLLGEEEAEILYGVSTPARLFSRLAADGIMHAVVKRGAAGACAVRDGREYEIPVDAAAEVIDTCGAGDAFNAGYLAGLLRRFSTERSLRLAAYCAARVVCSPSDNEALPFWEDARSLGTSQPVAR